MARERSCGVCRYGYRRPGDVFVTCSYEESTGNRGCYWEDEPLRFAEEDARKFLDDNDVNTVMAVLTHVYRCIQESDVED
jgi:hypothetical protein